MSKDIEVPNVDPGARSGTGDVILRPLPEADDAHPDALVGVDTAGPFDPSEHTVEEVVEYLADADAEEKARVLAAEAAGKARKSLLG